jgi:hypothetical protein
MQSMGGVNMHKIFIYTIIFYITVISFSVGKSDALIQIYSDSELSKKDSLYRNYITAVFKEDLIGQLPVQERAILYDTRIVIPSGLIDAPPITVWTSVQDRTVYFPIQTISFLDDIAAVAAWLSKNKCTIELAALYAGMIVSIPPPANQRFHPNPRAAFGLDDDVWDDPYVKNYSNQIFKTAVFFILAHELGRVRYNHLDNDVLSNQRSHEQELQADRFAIDAMKHIGVPPLGVLHLFTILSRMEGYVLTPYPLSESRIIQIASALERSPGDFIPPNENEKKWEPVVRHLGIEFRFLIPIICNTELRKQLNEQARLTTWEELKRSCSW